MKKLILVLCMIVCMFSLAACGEEGQKGLEDETAQTIKANAQQMVESIVKLDEAGLKSNMEYFAEDGQEPNQVLYSALESWKNEKDELGAYNTVNNVVATKNDKGSYIVDMTGVFANRNAEISLVVNNKTGVWEQIKFDLIYTLGEKMEQAALNTVMGMGTVFLILIIMILCISCFAFIPKIQAKFEKKHPQPEQAIVQQPTVTVVGTEEELTDDLELVAVITAAIAASEHTTADGLVVRSIRRVNTNKWKRA